jgi:serine/threonine-protein kinase
MVSGRHPFKADTDHQTMENIVSRDPVPLDSLVPDVDPQLEALINRAIAKDPEKRWPDCAAMQRALDQILSSTGAAVTDGDVATFLRDLMGDHRDKRRADLAAAIQAADQRGSMEPPASRRRAVPSSRGASLQGIIPLALEGGSAPAANLPPASEPSHVPPLLSSPPPPLVRTQRKRRVLPWLLLLFVLAVGAAAGALRMGYLRAAEPWLAQRLPPALRVLLPPRR